MRDDIPQGDIRYDAAAANMESPCRMPTKAQCQELINTRYITSEWTSMNGVNGYKFTNKSESSKYIFLPAGGYWNNTAHTGELQLGNYWSTGFFYEVFSAWYVYFNYTPRVYTSHTTERFIGYSIRPVK